MSLFRTYKNDNKKEIEGIWVDFSESPNEDGSIPGFLICRSGGSNKKYGKVLEEKTRPYRRQMELKQLPNEIAEKVLIETFIETICKDWRNIQDEGRPIEFSKENLKNLIETLPDVYERLKEEAALQSNFRAAALEEEAKN